MFKYKVNSRLLPYLRNLPPQEGQQDEEQEQEGRNGSFSIELSSYTEENDPENPGTPTTSLQGKDLVRYPLFNNSRRSTTRSRKRISGGSQKSTGAKPNVNNSDVTEPINNVNPTTNGDIDKTPTSELLINIELDFGWIFGWLERLVWLTMFVGVTWALARDFSKATRELCYVENQNENYPFNILPSLSRSMSSFRFGKFLWTISSATVFVARLLSNHFLHKLYEAWYAHNLFNKIFLGLAYLMDTLEIITLLMIPAFSLDCDPNEHSIFFKIFLGFTYTAELLQYFTKFLKRKPGILLFIEDVNNYYKQIGILIILQTFFIIFMMTGYYLHDILCNDMYYTIFTIGEYITVLINVRFKRDTVLFVK